MLEKPTIILQLKEQYMEEMSETLNYHMSVS